jgi:hypothetical protein
MKRLGKRNPTEGGGDLPTGVARLDLADALLAEISVISNAATTVASLALAIVTVSPKWSACPWVKAI